MDIWFNTGLYLQYTCLNFLWILKSRHSTAKIRGIWTVFSRVSLETLVAFQDSAKQLLWCSNSLMIPLLNFLGPKNTFRIWPKSMSYLHWKHRQSNGCVLTSKMKTLTKVYSELNRLFQFAFDMAICVLEWYKKERMALDNNNKNYTHLIKRMIISHTFKEDHESTGNIFKPSARYPAVPLLV